MSDDPDRPARPTPRRAAATAVDAVDDEVASRERAWSLVDQTRRRVVGMQARRDDLDARRRRGQRLQEESDDGPGPSGGP